MRVEELKEKLNELKVPKEWYSINEGLKFDAYILNKVYYYWEYFYFETRFDKEPAAYLKDGKIYRN